MANITIAGSCFVVTSRVPMADWEVVKKYRPQALKIVDEESKEELFGIGIGSNNINNYGVSFGDVSNDELKLAAMTMLIPADVENAAEYVADKAGRAVINLNKIEEDLFYVLEEIKAEKKKVADNITIII